MKTIERNYQMVLESAILRKQVAYRNYKSICIAWLQATWIGDDGNFCFLKSNYADKLAEAKEEFFKASIEVEHYRMQRGENHEAR